MYSKNRLNQLYGKKYDNSQLCYVFDKNFIANTALKINLKIDHKG